MRQETLRFGALGVVIEVEGRILRSVKLPPSVPEELDAAALAKMLQKLAEYEIDLSKASPFNRRAWESLRTIGWGRAITYGELASLAGSPRAIRAAGQACAKNPLPLIVPCHRVVAENGLGGFGFGAEWKRKLLELEAAE
jgi:O-6-methylguanine DNA methyltransferase